MSILERLGRERPKMNVVYAAVELLDQDIDIQNFYMEYCSTPVSYTHLTLPTK